MSEWVVNAMHRVPCVVAATLVALAISTCGSLAMCLGLAYYFLKLTQLCQDSLEGLAYGYAKKFAFKIVGVFIRKYRKTSDKQDQLESKNIGETSLEQKQMNEVVKEQDCQVSNKNESPEKEQRNDDVSEIPGQKCNMEKDNEINNLRLRKMKSDNEKVDTIKVDEIKDKEIVEEEKEHNKNENRFGDSIDHSEMHFHYTLFLMWLIIAALNVPSVLTWARNFR